MNIEDGTIQSIEQLDSPHPLIDVNIVTYVSNGLSVKGYLIFPKTDSPCPALIYCRGGINKVGMVRIERILDFALRGYVVIAPFYRGNLGGEGHEDFGGDDRYDVHNAIQVLKQLEKVKKEPYTIMGYSRGAIMALFASIDCPEIGQVIIRSGVSDMWLTYEERIDMRRMLKRVVGRPNKEPEQYDRRTPLHYVHQLHSPILVIHGTADEQVSVEHALKLCRALEQEGKPFELKLYEGLGHVFPPEQDKEAMDYIFKWINQQKEKGISH